MCFREIANHCNTIASVPPDGTDAQPISETVFNSANDADRVTAAASEIHEDHKIRGDPAYGELDPKEAMIIAVCYDTFDYGLTANTSTTTVSC